ncbi:MAG: hypothetical protein RMJ59_01380 [Candidatus Nitrosocaldus sp.]|nr:hypothetical protein [Candidatus Nitrosocaldus sp.]MDW8275017.1 hypothetical protein [Candidatus Nitrosocaldus sp.]
MDDDARHRLVIDRVTMSRYLLVERSTIHISGIPEGGYKYRDGVSNRVLGS